MPSLLLAHQQPISTKCHGNLAQIELVKRSVVNLADLIHSLDILLESVLVAVVLSFGDGPHIVLDDLA